jgi:hypothetical protein
VYFNLGPVHPKLFVEINKQYLSVIYADYWYISVIRFDSENTELADYSLFNLLFVLRSEGLDKSENHSVRIMGNECVTT